LLGGYDRRQTACNEDIDVESYEVRNQIRGLVDLPLDMPILDEDAFTLNVTQFS
jgi:hypothetical protein